MNDKRRFDRAVAQWLDDGSDTTPPEVIDAVLLAVRRTPQERDFRFPWRTSPMKRLAYAVAVLAVGVAALSALSPRFGIGSGPTPAATIQQTPSTSTSAPHTPRPGEATFTSTIHGISIDYPAGWQTRPATEPWTGGELSFDSPAADVIFDPTLGDRLYLVVASQPYGGLSEDEWRNEQDRLLCPDGGAFGSWTVDGADAFARYCSGHDGALVFTDTRGYLIFVLSDEPELAETYDWDWLKPVLETVDLRPEEAVDVTSPSPSP